MEVPMMADVPNTLQWQLIIPFANLFCPGNCFKYMLLPPPYSYNITQFLLTVFLRLLSCLVTLVRLLPTKPSTYIYLWVMVCLISHQRWNNLVKCMVLYSRRAIPFIRQFTPPTSTKQCRRCYKRRRRVTHVEVAHGAPWNHPYGCVCRPPDH